MSGVRVVRLATDGRTPTWVETDNAGRVVARGRFADALHGGGRVSLAPMRTVLVVPGTSVTARRLAVVGHTEAQARGAAALQVGESLATAPDRLHVAVGPPDLAGLRWVTVTEPELLRTWLEQAAALGVVPDVVTPDHLLLPEPIEETGAVAVDCGDHIAVRTSALAFAAEPELVPALLGGLATPRVHDGEEAEALLASGAVSAPVNLLQGAFSRTARQAVGPRELRLVAGLALAVLLSPLVLSLASLAKHAVAADRMERAAIARAQAVLPGATIQDPQAQVAARLAELRASAGFSMPAAALFGAVQGVEQAAIERIDYGEGVLRAAVSYTNYSDLDLLKAAIARAGVQVQDEGVRNEGGRIVSDLVLRRAQ
jgi:general secretion pathway protein L